MVLRIQSLKLFACTAVVVSIVCGSFGEIIPLPRTANTAYVECEGLRLEVSSARRVRLDDKILISLRTGRDAALLSAGITYRLENDGGAYRFPKDAPTHDGERTESVSSGQRSDDAHTIRGMFGEVRPGKYVFSVFYPFDAIQGSVLPKVSLRIENFPIEVIEN
jgi:hypothetical protein